MENLKNILFTIMHPEVGDAGYITYSGTARTGEIIKLSIAYKPIAQLHLIYLPDIELVRVLARHLEHPDTQLDELTICNKEQQIIVHEIFA